jgi:hypothetical protein
VQSRSFAFNPTKARAFAEQHGGRQGKSEYFALIFVFSKDKLYFCEKFTNK